MSALTLRHALALLVTLHIVVARAQLAPPSPEFVVLRDDETEAVSPDLYDVSFHDDTHGWAAGGQGTIMRTQDGGTSWVALNIGNWSYATFHGISFASETIGWAVGNIGTILRTSNRGDTWTAQDSGVFSILRDIQALSDDEVWIV
eukprot:CAMPEP_0118951740 /NCGR_PEP_ID=MMETSP1169-20130426/53636_1 /TAXON_ID=36882 /ORGANISM="Pyramimonas obovata, Strain CCMP722" /LENGTH=145 /DNA_ID=CAMNT_0006898853 /DNA_START=292 /DNA_END=726 /DNA_ORIENTATION=-